jgi:opacity protein-like surface antigen
MLIAVPAQGQRVTLGANFGGSSATADFGSSTGWKSGWSAGANLTYRLTSRFGVRADANFAQNDLAGAGVAIPGEQRFNKVSYIADGVWQREDMPGTRILPYVLAGVGAVRIHDKGSDSSFTRFAGNLGVGVGYKLGRLGLRAEGRNVMYKFDRFGYSKTQNDLLWQAGLTLRM